MEAPVMKLTRKVVVEGDGKTFPQPGQIVKVHYVGRLSNGAQFDTSRGFLQPPFEFTLGAGEVIKGWDQGVAQMSKGEFAELTMTADLAYGRQGVPGIPGGETLQFDVELIGMYTPRQS